jgi:predicted RNA-binding Zn-ribbon protein involved in translation (DUF1610 family)
MTYQASDEGFRGEVTNAAAAELARYLSGYYSQHCPSCGERVITEARNTVKPGDTEIQSHAKGCVELRSDVAEKL